MKKSLLKKVIQYFGYVITLISFVYIYTLIKDMRLELTQHTPFTFLLIIIFCLVSALFPFISAFTWKYILEFVSRRKILFRETFEIYIKSNIAKYLPGNVMQYVGRNYIGVKYGWTNTQMALSSILEIICLIAAPFTILVLLYLTNLWILPPSLSGLQFSLSIKSIVLALLIVAIIVIPVYFYFKNKFPDINTRIREYAAVLFTSRFLVLLSKVFIISVGSFFLNGFLFYAIGDNLFGIDFGYSNFISITCSLTIAGYSGILTPGVPGGIGVKESISIILLSAYGYNKDNIVMVLIASRLFSIIGDLIAFGFVFAAKYFKR